METKETVIAIAGNQWITSYLISSLVDANLKPSLIINMGNEWQDRISGYMDLSQDAERIGATVYRPEKYSLTSEKDIKTLTNTRIDLLIVFGWQRLIPDWLIQQASLGVWGVHGSPEMPPRGRGRAVFNWSLLLGYDRFYMYMFKINPGVDDGDIVDIVEFDINPFDDILSLYHKNCLVSTRMFINQIPQICAGTFHSMPQDNKDATYLPKRNPENGGLDWSQSSKNIVNLIRAVTKPYPGAFTSYQDIRITIWTAHVFDKKLLFDAESGEIIDVFPNGHFIVKTIDGSIYVREWEASSEVILRKGQRFLIKSGVSLPNPVI